MKKILIVEDEDDIRELIAFNLEVSGYEVIKFGNGEDTIKCLSSESPDLFILDVELPGISGFEVCRQIRKNKEFIKTPIIMLTARAEDEDIIMGLEIGADDYITKPFRPKVLLARVKATLRRRSSGSNPETDIINIHGLTIDHNRHEVLLDSKKIYLSVTEFSILEYLASSPGFVFSRNQIIDTVKGDGYAVTERSVDVQILGIRKKLGDFGRFIETVRGIGYRMVSP